MLENGEKEDLFGKLLMANPEAHHLTLFCRFESYFKSITDTECGAGDPGNNRKCFDPLCCSGEVQVKALAYNVFNTFEINIYITPFMFHVYSDDVVQWMIESGNIGIVSSDSYSFRDGLVTIYDPELTIKPYKFDDVFIEG